MGSQNNRLGAIAPSGAPGLSCFASSRVPRLARCRGFNPTIAINNDGG